MTQSKDMQAAIGWFKKQFSEPIKTGAQGTPFHLDFLTAIAIQESYEVWGRAYKIKTVPEVLELCVGDILDASGGRNKQAFPQDRAVLENALHGADMFKIARKALVDMAQVATEYKQYLKNENKFCHAFGIFQYDIQAFTHDADYFLNHDWRDFSKCLGKCLTELHEGQRKTYPNKKDLSDKELVYVAIAYNQGHADINKSFQQGFKGHGDTKYYGEYIWDYMQLAKNTPPAS